MPSSTLTKPEVAEIDTLERRRPGRFGDVSPALVPILRGDPLAATEEMPPDDEFVSARDPAAERQAAFKIVLIIVALVGMVMLFGH